jgi:hypothetical protein
MGHDKSRGEMYGVACSLINHFSPPSWVKRRKEQHCSDDDGDDECDNKIN